MITIPLWSMVMNVSVKSISFIFTCFVLNIWNSCYKIVFVSIMYILENWCARYIRKPKVMGIIVCLVYILLYIWFQNNTCVARCIPQDLKHQQSTLTDEIFYYLNFWKFTEYWQTQYQIKIMRFKTSNLKDPKHTELVSCASWASPDDVISIADDHKVYQEFHQGFDQFRWFKINRIRSCLF